MRSYNLYASLPFESGQNPLFDVIGKESRDWINSYDILPHDRRAEFTTVYGEILASYCYPSAPRDAFRVCADFVNILFLLDEVSDIQDPDQARETIHLLVRILGADPVCDDGSPLAKMLSSFVERFRKVTTPSCQRRFYQEIVSYMETVQQEAEYRANGKVIEMECYDHIRRGNGAVLACFVLLEPALGINLPDEVVEHPTFKEITTIGVDLICWSNDLYSFNREQSRKIDTTNIVAVLMEHKGYSPQQAIDHVGEAFSTLVQHLLEIRKSFPRFGPEIDLAVNKHIDAIEIWVVGHLDFSFVSERYFGKEGVKVKKMRVVKLYPRKS